LHSYGGLKSQDVEILPVFFAFLEERTTPYGKIFKILFQMSSMRHRSTFMCSDFVKVGRREIGEIVRYLPDKKRNKISPASQTVAAA